MTTLKRHHAAGMPPEAYDQVIAAVAESQTGADGFVAHYGVVDGDGITVIEIWDSQAQHDKWFDANVRSLLPPGTPEPEFWEIRASRTK
jgi:heme-degrading monooxygenase HmoA